MPLPEPKASLIERAVSRMHGQQVPDDQAVERPRSESVVSINGDGPTLPRSSDPFRQFKPDSDATTPPAVTIPPRPSITIDVQALVRKGFIVPGAEQTRTVSEFRNIKRPLLLNIRGRGGKQIANSRRIMITSALPGEGKTFCAINLALSLANERDFSVLLVDADVARPSVPAALGIEHHPGLMEALADASIDAARLILSTTIENLSVLLSGRPHVRATEFLASAAMSRLVERLSESDPNRIIIFDSPPLLVTTEASVLASHMGQIVTVVEHGKTSRDAVKAALSSLESAPGIASLVLNKSAEPAKKDWNQYGGYGYGYGG